ncbi:MAG TPA: two-component regulator propeller domain-containing protein [Bryobacteraceae bacterium]|nr:two-component regulator propeller domain-containing protein [Bryobacteraceae bacterium]
MARIGTGTILILLAGVPFPLPGALLPIRSYTTADGLAAEHIDCVYPDSHGFVWFCTPEGLTRFDGYRMVSFGTADGLAHHGVQAILETRTRGYLVGTAGGLSHFEANGGGRFSTYRPGADDYENSITALLETSAGRIWCGTEGGLFELVNGFHFRRLPLPGPFKWKHTVITDLLEDTGGNLWVGTVEGIDVVAKDGSAQHVSTKDGLPNEYVNALMRDRAGRVWAGTRAGLVLMRPAGFGGSSVQRVYQKRDGLIHLDVRALAQAADGSLWIATSGGISRLLPGSSTAVFENVTRRQGLTDRQITALSPDRAGNMWVGTEGAGAMRIEPAGFTTFREQDGLPSDRVWSVLGDRKGGVLAITISDSAPLRAVNLFDGVRFHPVIPKVLSDHPTWGMNQILLQARGGEWWAATQSGLCRFRAGPAEGLASRQPEACYAPDAEVFRVFEDSRGGIWASAQSRQGDRLMRWDPAAKRLVRFQEGPSHSPLLVSAFAEDRRGNIWMGTWVGGELYRYNGVGFSRYGRADGVPPGTAFALLVDGAGRLWIGANGGLGLIQDPGSRQIRGRLYSTTNGLASASVRCLAEDNSGRIYAGTAKGVDRLNLATGRIMHFTANDGLPHGEMTSAFRDAAGNLWFATTQGLSRLGPAGDRPPGFPSVRITQLRIPHREGQVSAAGETVLHLGRLQPSQNQLQVEFVGANNEPEESLSYMFALEGGGEGWTTTRQHTVNYSALAPGRYRFRVMALNSEGQASPAPAEIDFTVAATMVQSAWFRVVAAMLAGVAIYVLYRYRLAHLLAIEQLRTRIATDLHDDIGSSLSQIAILSEVTSRRVPPEQRPDLADIANLSRELVDSMSEIVWAVDPSQDRLGNLAHRIHRFASDLLSPVGIRVQFREPNAEHDDAEMGADARRQIFLICKEALHNVARHSACTEVVIHFELAKGWLSLSVTDDGGGFDAAQIQRGHGLASMEKRARQLGGRLTADSAPGRGTTIRLHVPVGRPFIWPGAKEPT